MEQVTLLTRLRFCLGKYQEKQLEDAPMQFLWGIIGKHMIYLDMDRLCFRDERQCHNIPDVHMTKLHNE